MIVSVVSLKTIDPYHLHVYAVKSWNMYPLQHGFRKIRSCETQLTFIEFIDDVTKNMENSLQTDVLIMDFSKAFDKVIHNSLTHKLNFYRIQCKTNT